MSYIANHWNGRLPLSKAVWVSLVAVSLLGCFIEYFIHSYFMQHSSNFASIAIIYFVLFHVLIFVWQAIGVLRSCDSNIKNYISSGWTRSTQLLVLTCFAATIIWGISLGQLLWKIKIDTQLMATEHKTSPEYSFEFSDNDTLTITGIISPGITRQLKKHFSLKPDISLITLNSPGGNIFEARGIAKLIQQNRLNTHVKENCFSSCTTVFIAGQKRTLAEEAKLGFHQYRINSKKLFAPNVNVKKELDKDIATFLNQGVSQSFLNKAFSREHDDMWFPNHSELTAAGIIN